ncbi:MAG: hypothetical protein LLG14_20060 [Nocardiaceae bacterium]|nr:hypothetical protein [Nocardiaceae bacterium]
MHMNDERCEPKVARRSRPSRWWSPIPAVAVVVLAGCSANDAAPPAPKSAAPSGSTTMSMPMDHGNMDHGNMNHGDGGIKLKNDSPAGDITMPMAMQMHGGMEMASSAPCDTAPTPEQQKAAVDLVNTSWADAKQYQSLDAARSAGYQPVTPAGLPVVHYMNRDYYFNTMAGGTVLNTAEPQSLVYANTPKGAVLVAAMFIATPWGDTPQPGGCLTQWHVHTNLCLTRTGQVVGVTETGCPAGSANRRTPPMLHIWYVPVPGGPTAIDASDDEIVAAAEKVESPANGTA